MQSQPPSSPWRQADAIQLLFSDAFKNGVFGNAYSGTMCTTKALGVTRVSMIYCFLHLLKIIRYCSKSADMYYGVSFCYKNLNFTYFLEY